MDKEISIITQQVKLTIIANTLNVPRRYIEDHIKFAGKIPYVNLFADIRRYDFMRQDALVMVRRQVPAEILPWIDHVEKTHDWSALSLCLSQEGNDATDKTLVYTASKWLQSSLLEDDDGDDDDSNDGKSGGVGKPGSGPKPKSGLPKH